MRFFGCNKKQGRGPQQSALKPVRKYATSGIQPDAYVQMDDRDDICARIASTQADWASYVSRDDDSGDRIVSNRSFDTESKDWYPRTGAPVGTTCTTASLKSPAVQRLTGALSCAKGSAHDTPQQDPTPAADPVKNTSISWCPRMGNDTESKDWYPRTGAPVGTTCTTARMGDLVGTTTAPFNPAMKKLATAMATAIAAVRAFSCTKGSAPSISQKDGTLGADPVRNFTLPSFKLPGRPPVPDWAIPAAAVATFVTCAALAFALPATRGSWSTDISVALIGNNVLSVNDVPRFLEALGEGHITQNSCLRANVSIAAITESGNGMYDFYKTDNAKITDDEDFHNCYDFGACTVNQLLLGNDDDLLYDNANGAYYSDGQNPCFQQVAYLWYLQKLYNERGAPNWDFVILADQTKRTFFNRTRQEILGALKDEYIPILGDTGATPVFVVTHAFLSSSTNKTVFKDIPTFTSRVYYGYQQYAIFLKEQLPESQEPRLAPVGLAFLVVWEEDRDMWKKLFYNEEYPSPYGSYLYGVILFYTLVGRMPRKAVALPKDMSTLWDRARMVKFGDDQDGNDQGTGFPSREEASYLFDVAERVMSLDYKPQSFINFTAILEFN